MEANGSVLTRGYYLAARFGALLIVGVGRDASVYVLDYEGDDPSLRRIWPGGNVTTIAAVK